MPWGTKEAKSALKPKEAREEGLIWGAEEFTGGNNEEFENLPVWFEIIVLSHVYSVMVCIIVMKKRVYSLCNWL